MRFFAFFSCFLLSLTFISPKTSLANPLEIYGDRIEFDVIRNGTKVGEHITTFKQDEGGWNVTSFMMIDIKFLGFTVYSFRYNAEEIWQNDQLNKLTVKIKDGDGKTDIKANRDGDKLMVEYVDDFPDFFKEDSYEITGPIFATNHWAKDVTKDNRVLNTLTGNINNVTITSEGLVDVATAAGDIQASKYAFSGDLEDTFTWYDENNRWVKLQFRAKDGSTVEYLCRTC